MHSAERVVVTVVVTQATGKSEWATTAAALNGFNPLLAHVESCVVEASAGCESCVQLVGSRMLGAYFC